MKNGDGEACATFAGDSTDSWCGNNGSILKSWLPKWAKGALMVEDEDFVAPYVIS